jgi:hypothetical protein
MNANMELSLDAVQEPTAHRYQIYRQSKYGCHFNHGARIDSMEDAVEIFLSTAPAFEGGGVHLWDHHEQRAVASAEWSVEKTRFGFLVRTRSNVFHDDSLALVARRVVERHAIVQSVLRQNAMAI